MSQLSFEEAAHLLGRAHELARDDDADQIARLALEQGIAESRAGNNMTAARTRSRRRSRRPGRADDPLLRVEAALRYEDATWRPGLSGVAALGHIREAIDVLDTAVEAGQAVEDEPELRARTGDRRAAGPGHVGTARRGRPGLRGGVGRAVELGSTTVEAACSTSTSGT